MEISGKNFLRLKNKVNVIVGMLEDIQEILHEAENKELQKKEIRCPDNP